MSVLTYETRGNTALITLTNGENRQNPAFAKDMLAALDKAEEDKSIRAVVIASNDEKNWSQGVDLNFLNAALKDGRKEDIQGFMYDMNEVFTRLLTFPTPVIAAITGHAFGNGAMLACCCDFRFMRSDRGYFCFPEVDISIPFMPSMISFIQTAVPYHLFNEMTLTGRRLGAPELERENVLTACENTEKTLETALAYAATFQKSRPIFAEQKRRLHKHIFEVMETEDKPLIENMKLMA